MQASTQIFWWKCSDNLWNAKEPNPLPSPRQRRLWRGEWRKGRNSLHTKFSIDGGPCQVVWVLFTSNLSVLPAWKEFFSGRLRSFGRSIYSISLGQGLSCRQSQFLRISGSIRSSKMRDGWSFKYSKLVKQPVISQSIRWIPPLWNAMRSCFVVFWSVLEIK